MLETAVATFVRRNLRGVWVRGLPPPGAAVWASNHHSYWDPFVATVLAQRAGVKSCVLMDQENLRRFPAARAIGAFGTREIRKGLTYLAQGRALVIYPEGELRPAGPIDGVSLGAAWYARRARVPLWAMAVRVVLRGHNRPEAYVRFEPVMSDGTEAVTTEMLHELDSALSAIDKLVSCTEPRLPLPGFSPIVRGRRSPEERMESVTRRLPWAR